MSTFGTALLAALGLGTAALVVSSSSSASTPTPTPEPTDGGNMSRAARLWAQLRAISSLDENQRLFLMLVAKGESNYSPTAHNKSAGEVAASAKAYDRLAGELAATGRPRAAYVIGSGGRFQRLVPYFAHDLRSIAPSIDPQAVFDGMHDIVSAVANAHALSTRYPKWNGKASGLRGGWGTLAWLDNPPADKVEKWRGHAREAKLMGASADGGLFLDVKLNPFPGDLVAVLRDLKAFALANP